MKKVLSWLIMSFVPFAVFALEKLDAKYQIAYGDPQAKIKITQYFSFQCPHCVGLFKQDFKEIKAKYLDTKKVYWIFHPIPMDMPTVQGMVCLEKLLDKEKRIFLEVLLDELVIENPQVTACLMEKAMEVFEKPISQLKDKEYLSETNAFLDAYHFLKQKEKIEVVPTIEINGQLYLQEIPDKEFIDSKLENLFLVEEGYES
jgi:hypothetical protein